MQTNLLISTCVRECKHNKMKGEFEMKRQKIKYDYTELEVLIFRLFKTKSACARELGCTCGDVTKVLKGESPFTQDKISLWCKCLQIETSDIGKYFFNAVVCN